MDPRNLSLLTDTIVQFLDEGRMFTAYDVTVETRTRENLRLRHSEVKNEIHQIQSLMDAVEFGHDGNGATIKWNKTQTDVGNGNWAFVYHPSHVDPNNYRSSASVSPAAASVAAPATQSSSPVISDADDSKDSGGKNDDGSYQTDYRNRLLVPTHFIRSIDGKPTNDIYLVCGASSLEIFSQSPASATGVTTQKIERNGDIRISSSTLKSAGMTGSKFVIESLSDRIKISEAAAN